MSSRLSFAIRRLENSLYQPSSKWVPFFDSDKGKAARGEVGLHLSFAMLEIQRDANPTAPTAIRLQETFNL